MNDLLNITVTKTATGVGEYVQILSKDGWSINIVLIAGKIELADMRDAKPAKRKEPRRWNR